MGKCFYCGKETTNKIEYEGVEGLSKRQLINYCCSKEHEDEILIFNGFVNKNYKKFITYILILSFLSCVTTPIAFYIQNLIFGVVIAIAPIFLIGLIIFKYPFATPQTNSKYGMKKTIEITKRIGWFIQIGTIVLAIMIIILCKLFL